MVDATAFMGHGRRQEPSASHTPTLTCVCPCPNCFTAENKPRIIYTLFCSAQSIIQVIPLDTRGQKFVDSSHHCCVCPPSKPVILLNTGPECIMLSLLCSVLCAAHSAFIPTVDVSSLQRRLVSRFIPFLWRMQRCRL